MRRGTHLFPASLGLFLGVGATLQALGGHGLKPLPGWAGVLVVYLEGALALWLLAGSGRGLSLVFASVAFLGFALQAAWHVFLGSSTCGWLGDLPVSPLAVFGLHMLAAGALLPCLLKARNENESRNENDGGGVSRTPSSSPCGQYRDRSWSSRRGAG